jgi:hypothetical protein
MKITKEKVLSIAVTLSLLFSYSNFFIASAQAATITPISDTMSNQTISASATNNFSFDAVSGIPASGTVTITFPSGFSAISTSSATSSMSGATFAVSGNVITVTNGTTAVTAGTTVTISGITATNPSTASSSTTQYIITVSDSGGDSASIAVAIVTSSQVSVTATINPTITFSISSNSINFGVLTTASVTTESNTLTLSTNAGSGASISIQDTRAGLYNIAHAYTIHSNTTTLAAGSEGYGVNASSSSLTVQSPFSGTGDSVGAITTSTQTIASVTAPVNNSTTTVNYLASISNITPSGPYSDTITYIATGTF